VPAMALDVIEGAMEIIEETIPAVVDAIVSAPTVVMDAIRIDPPKAAAVPEASAERATAPFVTETMAQLYLEQGHRAEAIDIYRQLVAARPTDAALRGRLEAIEQRSG